MTPTFLYVLTILAVTCIAAAAFVQVKKPSVDVSPYAAGAGIAIIMLVVVFFTTSNSEEIAESITQAQNLGLEAAPSDPVEEELSKGRKEELKLRD